MADLLVGLRSNLGQSSIFYTPASSELLRDEGEHPDVVRKAQIMGYESLSRFAEVPDDPGGEEHHVDVIDTSTLIAV
ncbi:hypothetical protein [Pseudomonas sp. 25571]|uniref:hypothetical protein n=1 Tax=Pseudomonas sp. 25571 TaxID=2967216 RepID=UPI002363E5CA|nr:hypothetical protein [Pseudomonas sp. 25571]MDD2064509.1 hypothetical protein [Pseudomonas sp. 25571]